VRYNETELLQNFIGRHKMKGATRYAALVGVIVLVLLIVGIIVAAVFHVLLDVLYIFLMVLAVLMIAATLFQVYSIMMLVRTIKTVRDETKPLLSSVQETVGIVKDTAKTAGHTVSTISNATRLTSDFALGPSVRVVAGLVALQQVFRVFFGRGYTRTRAEQRRQQQMEAIQASAGGD
jgi:hypothetical protein